MSDAERLDQIAYDLAVLRIKAAMPLYGAQLEKLKQQIIRLIEEWEDIERDTPH